MRKKRKIETKSRGQYRYFSEEEKLRIMKRVESLRAQGIQLKDICEDIGILVTTYCSWKRKLIRDEKT